MNPVIDPKTREGVSVERASTPAEARNEIVPVEQPDPLILVLDDDSFQHVLLSRMLRGLGFNRLQTSENAREALELIRQRPAAFDVIVCDLNMPGMDGIEFLQALNTIAFSGSVILLSGEGTRIMHSVHKLLGNTCVVILGAIQKPASSNALHALLARWKPPVPEVPKHLPHSFCAADIETATREHQWTLHYQPKVDLQTGELAGVEALLRWRHPVHGMVYPDHFIGLAEECGAIDGVTDWLIREAVEQLIVWRQNGLHMRIALNVSMENLRSPDFASKLGTIVRNAGISPEDVTLEITESRLMSPLPAPLESLVRLRMRRFNLSIDDFGTGHSSLAQLRDVPFTELKVDRGFVHGARFNSIILPILEGSVGLAKKLGMLCVAEGVETEEDWHLLREIDCDLAQGYFISRPMVGDAMAGWLEEWRSRCKLLCKGVVAQ